MTGDGGRERQWRTAAWAVVVLLASGLGRVVRAEDLGALYGRRFVARFHEVNRVHAQAVVGEADDLAERRKDDLGVEFTQRAEIVICPTEAEFDRAVGQGQPAWVVGVAQPQLNRIVLKQGSVKGMRRVVRHEVVHLLVGKALGEADARAPRWLQEGAAKYYGEDWSATEATLLANALKAGRLHTLDELADFPTHPEEGALAYAESYVLVEYLVSLDPAHGLSGFIREFRLTGDVRRAFLRAYGRSQEEIEAGWRAAIQQKARTAPFTWGVEATAFLLMVVVFVFGYLRVRRRSREIRQRMEEEALMGRLESVIRPQHEDPKPPTQHEDGV